MSHPTPEQLRRFAAGELEDARFETIAAHVEHCEQCGIILRQSDFFPTLTVDDSTRDTVEIERAGSVVGPYKLLQKVGEGGMGVVYMAEQEHPVRRMVALKIIKPGMDSRQVIARFEAERQALAMMDHHHIAKVLDAGSTASGRPYFAMELVKGVPITDYCDRNKLSVKQRLEMFVPVCQAIQHAHQKGIIHRDIKPSNVLVTLYDGKPVPKVIDFGIAKATQQKLTERTMFTGIGQILGTFEYMSPEQAEMNQLDIDTRSDVYSLGVMLYELLTGSTPITKRQLQNVGLEEMLRAIRETEPPKPSTRLSDSLDTLPSISAVRQTEPGKLSRFVRGDLDWIVMKALEKDRTRRYETATSLALDVERFLKDEEIEASPPSKWYRMRKFARRNKSVLVAGSAILGILLATTGTSSTLAYLAVQAEKEANRNETAATKAVEDEQRDRDEEQRLRRIAQANFDEAIREATRSKQVIDFFKRMLNGIRPAAAMGRDTTMLRDILSRMSSRLDEGLASQPLVEAELRVTIGDVYEQFWRYSEAEAQYRMALNLYRLMTPTPYEQTADILHRLGELPDIKDDEALDLLEESLHLRRQIQGTPDIRAVHTMRAIEKRRGYRQPDSLEKLNTALETLKSIPGDHELATISLLTELALAHHLSRQDTPATRRQSIEALLDRADRLASRGSGDAFRRAEALVSYVRSRTGNRGDPLEALRAAEHAVDLVRGLDDGKVAAFDYLINLARCQVSALRYQDAKATIDRVIQDAGKYFDGDSRRTAQLHLDSAEILYSLGHRHSARAVQDRALEILGPDRHRDAHPYTHFADRFDPRIANRLELFRRASWEHSSNVQGPTNWETLTRGDLYATALLQQGKHQQAVAALNKIYLKSNRHWQYVTALNIVANEPYRNDAVFARALDVAERIAPSEVGRGDMRSNAWIKEDAARAILVDPNAPADVLRRAVTQAEQARRQGRGQGLCLALARYRQGRFGDVHELLEPALNSGRYRTIALTLAALTAMRQGQDSQAMQFVDELGLLSTARVELPERFVLAMRENLFIAFFMQAELQELMGFPSDRSDAERVAIGLERFARFSARHGDSPKLAGRLARYYVWFRRHELHHQLCKRLILDAPESTHRDNAFVSMAFLCAPTSDLELCRATQQLSERALNAADLEHLRSHGPSSPRERSVQHVAEFMFVRALSAYRLDNFDTARQWVQRSEPYVAGLQRGTWAAIKAMSCARLGLVEEANSALEIADELIWPGPSRDRVEFELLVSILPVDEIQAAYHHSHHPTGSDRLVNWMLLEEATNVVAEASRNDPTK